MNLPILAETENCPSCNQPGQVSILHDEIGNYLCQVCQRCRATFTAHIIQIIGKIVTVQYKIHDQYLVVELTQRK